MDPIEINAGTNYLRQLRADDLLDDRNVLRANGFSDPDAHVATRVLGWLADTDYTWAIADPPTGALLGEVGLLDIQGNTARAMCWLADEHRGKGIAPAVLGSVLRFGFGALDLRTVALGSVRIDESAGQPRWQALG